MKAWVAFGKKGWVAIVETPGSRSLRCSRGRSGPLGAAHGLLERLPLLAGDCRVSAMAPNAQQAKLLRAAASSAKAGDWLAGIHVCSDKMMGKASEQLLKLSLGQSVAAPVGRPQLLAGTNLAMGLWAKRGALASASAHDSLLPKEGRLELFVDGSVRDGARSLGWGAVMCSCADGVLEVVGSSRGSDGEGRSHEAELLAIVRGLESVPSGFSGSIVVKSDCEGAVAAAKAAAAGDHSKWNGPDCAPVASFLAVVEGRSVDFEWVRGHAGDVFNEAADLLARLALGMDLPKHPKQHEGHPRAKAAKIAASSTLVCLEPCWV